LPHWIATVPEVLRAERFTTGAITENGWVTFAQGFGRGFDTYRENKGPHIGEPKGQADVTFATAEEWLGRHRDERFFLFLHTYQVHFPYVPPADYAGLFTEGVDPSSSPSVDAANYDREIRFTDDMLRKLYATMRELGIADDTIVVLTSDHGEEFSEHGCIWHGEQLYDEVTRVPLMIQGPGVAAGKRVPEPVGLVDVMPTILGLVGVAEPPKLMGVDLAPALASGHAPADRRIVTESWVDKLCPGKTFQKPGFVVRQGARKLARYRRDGAFAYEAFDLAADPGERSNLFAADPAAHADLRAFVDGYEEDAKARATALRTEARATAEPGAVPIDDRQREKLRALGYAD
jgi:arylsulfatase A-like enzyme